MTTRQAESGIPDDEAVYRSISVEDVVDGDVQAHAVDMPRCSFNRSRFSRPRDVLVSTRPHDNGVVQITPGELPPPIPRDGGRPYMFYAADDPIPENNAHCEVRIKPVETEFNTNHKVNKAIRAKARSELARRLHIVIAPRPV